MPYDSIPVLSVNQENLLKQPHLPDARRLADSLLRDVENLPHPVFLAIDDYHTVGNKDIHLFMTRLMRRLPANLHLVLITRSDPPGSRKTGAEGKRAGCANQLPVSRPNRRLLF